MILGFGISTKVIGGIILLIACCFFMAQLLFQTWYNECLAELFGHDFHEENRTGVKSIAEDPAAEGLIRTTVDFFAALVITTALFIATPLVLPAAAWFLVPIVFGYVVFLASRLDIEHYTLFDLNRFNGNYGYSSTVVILISLALLTIFQVKIGVLSALFVFIAIRQIMTNLQEKSRIIFVNRNQKVPNFLHRYIEDPEDTQYRVGLKFPKYLQARSQNSWFEDIIGAIIKSPVRVTHLRWCQRAFPPIDTFVADILEEDGGEQRYLINLYPKPVLGAFKREIEFHLTHPVHPLTLPFVGSRRLNDCGALLYKFDGGQSADGQFFNGHVKELLVAMWCTSVPPGQQNLLGTPYLVNALNESGIDMLKAIARTSEERESLACVQNHLPLLRQKINALPRQIHNPHAGQLAAFHDANKVLKLSIWGHVEIQPIGSQLGALAGVEVSKMESDLAEMLEIVSEHRADCLEVTVQDIQLAATSFSMAKSIANGPLINALRDGVRLAQLLNDQQNPSVK